MKTSMHIPKLMFLGTLLAAHLLNNARAEVPVVNWIRPTNGSTFAAGSGILLRASASDPDGTLALIDFLAGTNLLWRVSGPLTNGTYSYMWSNAPAGAHQLHAEAEDNTGERGVSASVQIVVTNAPPLNNVPVVNLVAPTNGAVFPVGTPILLSVSASDSDGTLNFIEFFAGATVLRTLFGGLTNGVYSIWWSNAPPGMYFLSADAQDNAGGRGISASVQISVTGVTNECPISISPTGRVHGAGSETAMIDVSVPPGCTWSYVNTNAWISTLPFVGPGDGALQYTVAANPWPFLRAGVITISGLRYIVTQDGSTNTGTNVPPACSVVLSPGARSHGSGVSTGIVTVTTGSNCLWVASPSNSWITILSQPTNSGSGTVTYGVASNAGPGRTGHIHIEGQIFSVAQAGITNTPPPNVLPVVNWIRPTNGAVLEPGTPTLLTVDATDSDGTISYVEFYAGSIYLARGINELTNSNYNLTWTNPPPGIFQLRAEAVDNAGGRGASAPVQVFVGSPGLVDLGTVEVETIGHRFLTNGMIDFLIDQDQSSGGGGVLQSVSVNWDTNIQFKLTVAAPPHMKFMVAVPPGRLARFGGFLWWESTRGGFSASGQVTASFSDLEGTAPGFTPSDSALSDSHGFFGFVDLESTGVSNSFSFTSITLTGTVAPQYTGNGAENYLPHLESSMYLSCSTTETNDPGNFVSILPAGPLPMARMMGAPNEDGVEIMVYGRPGRTHVVECSPDTAAWTAISSRVMPPAGFMSVSDSSATTVGNRFYRVVELP